LDAAELSKTRAELDKEKKARVEAEALLARTQLLHQAAEIARRNDNAEKLYLQKRVNELSAKVEMYKWRLGENQVEAALPPLPVEVRQKLGFEQQSCIDLGEYVSASTRAFALDPAGWALVGLEQAGQHGILKVTFDGAIRKFIPLHEKCIRDMCLSPEANGHLLTASMDKTLKICSAATTMAIAATFEVSHPCWSCCWSDADPNYIFAGVQNNSIVQFDIRQPRTPVRTVSLNPNARGPQIRSMIWLASQECVVATDGCSLQTWSPASDQTERLDMATTGSCLSLSTDGGSVLAAFRTLQSPCIYVTVDAHELQSTDPKLTRFFGQHRGSLLTRSWLFRFDNEVYVCGSDEQLLEVRWPLIGNQETNSPRFIYGGLDRRIMHQSLQFEDFRRLLWMCAQLSRTKASCSEDSPKTD